MSFSSEIKEKLCAIDDTCACCPTALLSGIFQVAGKKSDRGLALTTENRAVAELIVKTVLDCFGYQVLSDYKKSSRLYTIQIQDALMVENIEARIFSETAAEFEELMPFQCCKAAFVRGAFLGAGSISDPEKSYHLEFDVESLDVAKMLAEVLETLGAVSKITHRKRNKIVYIKDYETIADVLGLIGAGSAAMEVYNISIEKELRNQINRQLNCESANQDKVVQAYGKHLQAIEKIQQKMGLDKLPESLQEIARVRKEYPDESLKELGKRLEVPIGKSGVNHRLNRLIQIAEELP